MLTAVKTAKNMSYINPIMVFFGGCNGTQEPLQ